MIYNILKKYIFRHMLSGLILALVIVLISLINMYHCSIKEAVNDMNRIVANTANMKLCTDDIDFAVKKVLSLLPKNYTERSHKELLLLALDDIKMTFKDSEITIVSFEEKEGFLLLGINIKASIPHYSNLVKDIGYLQSLRFPSFHLKTLVIGKSSYRQTDDFLTCKIEGILKMPAEKLKVKI